jgi:uncharacterized protein YwqG
MFMAKKSPVTRKHAPGPEKKTSKDPLEALRIRITKMRRSAFKPIVEEGDGPTSSSKFSGKAFIPEGEVWPLCPNCKRPMQLFLQLDLGALPKEIDRCFGTGLLQMFYCTSFEPNCEVESSGWLPFSKNCVLRILKLKGPGKDLKIPPIDRFFPPKRILGWKTIDDYPGLEVMDELGVEIANETYDRIFEQDSKLTWPSPDQKDKLGGWPFWCQSPEYPQCPKCGKTMRLLFQLDSEDNLPYMFGDVGTGHITQCEEHLDVVAFGWACH